MKRTHRKSSNRINQLRIEFRNHYPNLYREAGGKYVKKLLMEAYLQSLEERRSQP